MKISLFVLAISAAVTALPALAQWSGSIGGGIRNFHLTERNPAGSVIVREAGNLAGVLTDGAYHYGNLLFFGAADIYMGKIDYRGQTQVGQAIASDTGYRMLELRAGAIYQFNAIAGVLAALEWERWQRDIHGVAGASGLQEHTTTTRLIAGVMAHWLLPRYGVLRTDAAIVLARPERLDVRFSGVFDSARLTTRSSTGLRLEARLSPDWAPRLEARVRYDASRIGRSEDVGLTSQGAPAGAVAQPARSRQSLTGSLHYLF